MGIYKQADFKNDCPPPRIIGTEMEYYIHPGSPANLDARQISQGLRKQGIASANGYCTNGARVYPEFGIEYATPECAGPAQAAAADFAGMAIINELTAELLTSEGSQAHFPLLRHTGAYDNENNSFDSRGYHQNFLTPEPENSEHKKLFKEVMSSFLSTRVIWDGSGMVANGHYLLSQKAPGIGSPVLSGYGRRTSHGEKPLAGLMVGKKSTAADKLSEGWGLLEVRSADSHMSREQSFLSLAVTSLVMRLVEQGFINDHNAEDFVLKRPVQSLQVVNYRPEALLELASGKEDTAASQQERFADAISTMVEKITLPEDEQRAAARFHSLCQKFGELSFKDPKPLAPDVEWATKLYYLQQKFGRGKSKIKTNQRAAFDLQWHRIDNRSIGKTVYSKFDETLTNVSESEIKEVSPPNTRAAARSKAIKKGAAVANWNKVTLRDGRSYDFDDFWSTKLPIATRKPERYDEELDFY